MTMHWMCQEKDSGSHGEITIKTKPLNKTMLVQLEKHSRTMKKEHYLVLEKHVVAMIENHNDNIEGMNVWSISILKNLMIVHY